MTDQRTLRHTLVVTGIPRVLDIGWVQNVLGHPRRMLDCWVLGIVTAGHFGLEVAETRVTVGLGEYYLLPRRVAHGGLDNAPFDAVFFHFLQGTSGGEHRCELPVTGECPAEMDYVRLFRFLEPHFRSGLMSGEELGAQLWAVLGQLALMQRQKVLMHADPKRALAGDVLDYVRSNYTQEVRSSLIASQLGYSYSYLERVFRRSFGCSIHQEVLRLRVQNAAHALQMGKSLKHAARDAGFSDYYYFLKVFKRIMGTSPGAFQASHRTAGETSPPERAELGGGV
jgi:AraC-like DNA-binding protein